MRRLVIIVSSSTKGAYLSSRRLFHCELLSLHDIDTLAYRLLLYAIDIINLVVIFICCCNLIDGSSGACVMDRDEGNVLVAIHGDVATCGIAACCASNFYELRLCIVSSKDAVDVIAVHNLVTTVEVHGISV